MKKQPKKEEPTEAIIPYGSPTELIKRATDVAAVCREIVEKTAVKIQGKRYVQVEGWQAIATAHGFAAGARDVDRIDTGWKAVGELRRISDGCLIATAEGFVGDDEGRWADGKEYAARAMAQTRAISRVCRSAFAHVVVLISTDLATTPAEEIPHEQAPQERPHSQTRSGARYDFKKPTDDNIRKAGVTALRGFLEKQEIPESFVMELCHQSNLADGSEETLADMKTGTLERLNTQKYRERLEQLWKDKQSKTTVPKERANADETPAASKRPMLIDCGVTPEQILKLKAVDSWKEVIIPSGVNKDIALGDLTKAQLTNYIGRWKPSDVDEQGMYSDEDTLMDAALTLAANEAWVHTTQKSNET